MVTGDGDDGDSDHDGDCGDDGDSYGPNGYGNDGNNSCAPLFGYFWISLVTRENLWSFTPLYKILSYLCKRFTWSLGILSVFGGWSPWNSCVTTVDLALSPAQCITSSMSDDHRVLHSNNEAPGALMRDYFLQKVHPVLRDPGAKGATDPQ